jgi:uncharacterized OB-fold protein
MSNASNVIIDNKEWKKPRPNVDHDNKEFWDGLKQHKFMLWKCGSCGAHYWPKAYCNQCEGSGAWASNMKWVETSGKGKIFCFNVHHMAFHPAFKDDIPYAYVLVEMNEGPLVSAMLLGTPPDDIHKVGQPVEVVYEDHPKEDFTMLRFRIAG